MLSIDVGIKNLSFCLFDLQKHDDNSNHLKVVKWDNIDLSEKTELVCIDSDKNGVCNKPAKFSKGDEYYCIKHSKKHNYLQPCAELKQTYLNKQKIQSLIDIATKYKIKYEIPTKKANILKVINEFNNNTCYTLVPKINATKVDLVTIGRNIQHKFDEILQDDILSIDTIIIENQIGPIANKMKTIQGMISQYFIMRNNKIRIEFISACNKLKDFLPNEKITYKERKKLGVQACLGIMNSDLRFQEWQSFFCKNTKKDDLSDSFLQGLWFVKYKLI